MMNINEIYEKVTKKAWEDEAFKEKLLKDSRAAIREAAGIEIPESVKVTVHESRPDDLQFVLPANPGKASAELSDSELDQVAGGLADGKPLITDPLVSPNPRPVLPPVHPGTPDFDNLKPIL